ncbi:hypothetical protein ACI3PL_28755, partial [Lacticaseibacillus paracasei]
YITYSKYYSPQLNDSMYSVSYKDSAHVGEIFMFPISFATYTTFNRTLTVTDTLNGTLSFTATVYKNNDSVVYTALNLPRK